MFQKYETENWISLGINRSLPVNIATRRPFQLLNSVSVLGRAWKNLSVHGVGASQLSSDRLQIYDWNIVHCDIKKQ